MNTDDVDPRIQRLLTSKFVAAKLGISPVTLTNLVKNGEIKAVSYGKHRRFTPEDVEEFIVRMLGAGAAPVAVEEDEE